MMIEGTNIKIIVTVIDEVTGLPVDVSGKDEYFIRMKRNNKAVQEFDGDFSEAAFGIISTKMIPAQTLVGMYRAWIVMLTDDPDDPGTDIIEKTKPITFEIHPEG